MNRKERRANGVKEYEPVLNIKRSELEAMKQDALRKAMDRAFFLMLAIPVMVVHDKFSELIPLKGKESREVRFCDMVLELYDTFQKDYVTIEDLQKCLLEEACIDVQHLNIK